METLLLYLIGAVGCTVIVTSSSICSPIRKAGCRLLLQITNVRRCPMYCAMCAGFWVGVVVGCLYGHRTRVDSFLDALVTYVMFGFATSIVAHFGSWWLRTKGLFTDPEHDGWKYDADGKFEELD